MAKQHLKYPISSSDAAALYYFLYIFLRLIFIYLCKIQGYHIRIVITNRWHNLPGLSEHKRACGQVIMLIIQIHLPFAVCKQVKFIILYRPCTHRRTFINVIALSAFQTLSRITPPFIDTTPFYFVIFIIPLSRISCQPGTVTAAMAADAMQSLPLQRTQRTNGKVIRTRLKKGIISACFGLSSLKLADCRVF